MHLLVTKPASQHEPERRRWLRYLPILIGVGYESIELDAGAQTLDELARFRPGAAQFQGAASISVRADPHIVTLGAGHGLEMHMGAGAVELEGWVCHTEYSGRRANSGLLQFRDGVG